MDRTQQQTPPAGKASFDWLPQHMPGVARLIREKREQLGNAWVDLCWRHGVVGRQPGWFFAGEGALMVGTMWDDPAVVAFSCARYSPTQVLVVMRPCPPELVRAGRDATEAWMDQQLAGA